MAWRTIASTETDPGAPLTAELMKALADNPAGAANGDVGAPRTKDAALDTGAATAAGIAWVEKRVLGRIIMAATTDGDTYSFGDEIDGDLLRYANANYDTSGGPAAGTTWQCMGYSYEDGTGAPTRVTLWQQVG